MTLRLPRSIEFRGKEIALLNSQFYYSNPNITSTYGNHTFSVDYRQGGVDKTLDITLPDGFYTYSDIDAFIKQHFDSNGVWWLDGDNNRVYPLSIVENAVYYSATISFIVLGSSLPSGYANPNGLNFDRSVVLRFGQAFGNVIGFTAPLLPATLTTVSTSFNSSFTPNITPVDSYIIGLNLVNDITFNSTYSNVVYILNSGNTAYGGLINERPPTLQFYPISDGSYSSIILTIRDQSNETAVPLIDYSGTIFKFIIRDRQ
jgi:hypothetical protein